MNISEIAKNKDLCCGCNACAVICPKQAIQMVEDEVGQLYPQVDEGKCVGCSQCTKVCCEMNEVPQLVPLRTVAATYKNKGVSAKSSSGGLFAALAEAVLNDNGIVYGTSFSDDFKAEVIGIDSMKDLHLLQGSKYVRSSMGNIFFEVKQQLNLGRKVLFSGVPCQVAALRQYLHKDYENLLMVDIVCHGTPSSKMFLDYLNYVQRKENKQITEFYFRDKDVGQDTRGKVVYKQNHFGKVVYKQNSLKAFQSSYYKLFLNCVTFRDNCYSCKFASPERVGDISLCDYWGIDEIHPTFVETVSKEGLCGVSAVMINTDNGAKLMGRIKDQILQIDTDYYSVRKFNPQLNHPSVCTTEHDKVMGLYAQLGYEAVDQYYHSHYWTKIITSTLGQILPGKTKKQLLDIKRRLLK